MTKTMMTRRTAQAAAAAAAAGRPPLGPTGQAQNSHSKPEELEPIPAYPLP